MLALWRPALVIALAALTACQTVPVTGRSQLVLLPEGAELQMGLDSYQQILKKSRVSTDPALTEQVTRVGRRIAEATGRQDYQWEFKVIEDKQANAFCLPGGKVAVYTGILPITRDDAGLAAVLGHEVAHAVARHGGERLSQQMAAEGLTLATTQALLGGRDPRVGQLVGAALGAGVSVGVLLPFSRAQESEADHLGLIYMAKAGYHPRAARDLWVRMGEASRDRQQIEFLSTHPLPATRISQIDAWIPEALKHYQPR
ncbi:MAG TPA: M48 family metallopeptidase [Methylomirabilota bacterium]|nr:M48 family metallopeptidase [Methylomirabilota bacterium]